MFVNTEYAGARVTPEAWFVGPVSPRTPTPLAAVAATVGWVSVGSSATTFCWFSGPVPRPPTLMLNVRFFQMTLLYSSGYEVVRQVPLVAAPAPVAAKCPAGHTTVAG